MAPEDYRELQILLIAATLAMLKREWDKVKEEAVRGDCDNARTRAPAVKPNPSLERTPTGRALGPRSGQCHHPLRGPSALPASAAQLKR